MKLINYPGENSVRTFPDSECGAPECLLQKGFHTSLAFFLAAGSISAPEKFYHFEIVCPTEPKAEQLKNIIATFDIEAKIVPRKKYYVVYIKEGSQIVDILNVMEAPVSLMELENIRIVKEMRGSVNRQVNCETANINKTVSLG